MPRPHNERQSLEQERAGLARQLAAYRQELENGSPHKTRWEWLDWQIRKAERRLEDIKARLTAPEESD
jgi:DNA repair exonuclease SbcCD ATPase subunit